MEKSNLSALLNRYVTGQVTDAEKQKIEMFFEVIGSSHPEDIELSKEKEDKIFALITSPTNTSKEIKALDFREDDKGRFDRLFVRIAAILLVLSVVGLGLFLMRDHFDPISSADKNKIILTDGSLVWLQAKSNISFYEKGVDGFRHANLKGTALFEVTKDPDHPFILQCEGLTVKVLGTSFSLKKTDNGIEVLVMTGKVAASIDSDSVLIMPGEKAFYDTRGNKLSKVPLESGEIAQAIHGTEYDMSFDDETLGDVVKRVEKKFDVQIELASEAMSNCHLTADLSDHSLSSTLARIQDVLHVQYSIEGNIVKLTGEPCQ